MTASNSDELPDVSDLLAHEAQFIERARMLLARRTGDFLSDQKCPESAVFISVWQDAPAYEAAVEMRASECSWLCVHDANQTRVGFVNEQSLAEVLEMVDASPFFGEQLLAEILPPLEPLPHT